MSFSYDVITEDEVKPQAKEFPLLPNGTYDFAVLESKFAYAQESGNPMIKLQHRVIHEGKEYSVFDQLIGTPKMSWKTRQFCECVDLVKEYEAKQFNEDMAGNRRGKFIVKQVGETPKRDGSGYWPAKNEVVTYISAAAAGMAPSDFAPRPKPAAVAPAEAEPFNDDVPF